MIKAYEAMNNEFTYVPPHMRDGYKLWIENGISPGSFGMAVITNDLKEACGKADIANQQALISTVAWFWTFAPADCWGSPEKAAQWRGIQSEAA